MSSAILSLQRPHPKACLLPVCLLCEQVSTTFASNIEVDTTVAPNIAADIAVMPELM